VFDGWSQTVVRNIEIEERAAHKDSGGMDLLIECVLAIDEQDLQAFPSEQASALETGESRADDGYVIIAHKIAQKPLLQSEIMPGTEFLSSTLYSKGAAPDLRDSAPQDAQNAQ
jgi:hypothetical protein